MRMTRPPMVLAGTARQTDKDTHRHADTQDDKKKYTFTRQTQIHLKRTEVTKIGGSDPQTQILDRPTHKYIGINDTQTESEQGGSCPEGKCPTRNREGTGNFPGGNMSRRRVRRGSVRGETVRFPLSVLPTSLNKLAQLMLKLKRAESFSVNKYVTLR